MRMRRTAFIVALMTVFTVSLFAQSRGRNYIKQNISEWGGCRNVAITDTGGDLALNGKNDYAYTAGIPQALADALEKYHDDDDYIDDVQLTEDGEWLILVGKNGESFLTHDHTCRKAAFCAQEKIVGSRPPNRVRNCVTDLEKTDR